MWDFIEQLACVIANYVKKSKSENKMNIVGYKIKKNEERMLQTYIMLRKYTTHISHHTHNIKNSKQT